VGKESKHKCPYDNTSRQHNVVGKREKNPRPLTFLVTWKEGKEGLRQAEG